MILPIIKELTDSYCCLAWFSFKGYWIFDSAAASETYVKGLKVITTQTDLITATSRFSHITLSGMFSVDPHKVKETDILGTI